MDYKLNKSIPIPFYYQIQVKIKDSIENGEWKSGQFIPTERELSDRFGVSRITTRKALENLTIEGIVRKIKGKGSVVSDPKIEGKLFNGLIGTYQDLVEQGFEVKNEVLSSKITYPSTETIRQLDLLKTEKVYLIERLRFIKEEPYHYSKIFIPKKICTGFNAKDLIDNSLYEVLKKKYKIYIFRIKRTLEADIASLEESKLFKIKKGSPILFFLNISFLEDGTPIEYTHNKIRGDMSKFTIDISYKGLSDLKHNINSNNKLEGV